MSNSHLPPELAAMLEALEATGAKVSVHELSAAPENENSPFDQERAKAVAAMQTAGYDAHRACLVANAMTLCVDLGSGHVTALVEHMATSHDCIPAVDWLIATYRLTSSLFPAIVQAEIDTGHAFNFTNKSASPSEITSEATRLIAQLTELREVMATQQSARKH